MNDEKILALFFARSEDAIRLTDSTYGRRLFQLSDRILHCPEDAQECVNDTYLRTWNAIPPTRPNSLFSYLAKICRNLSLSKLNWENAAKRRAEVVSLTQEMEECIPDPRREAQISAKEMGRILNAFLDTLSEENQIVFLRRYWFADTTAEIAQRYGIQEGTVITRLHRLRKKLAQHLAKEGILV